MDEFDSTAVTEELPPVEAGWVRSDLVVFSGRAQPVVLSGVELALIGQADDPGAYREWLRATDRGDLEGDGEAPVMGPGGQPLARPDQRRSLGTA